MTTTTDDRILEAAADLFAERGYAATTTRAIAERAGVNEVTLFRRFENKAGILRALGERLAQQMAGLSVSRLPEPEDTRGTINAMARMEIETAIKGGAVAMRLAFDAASTPEIGAMMAEGPGSNFEGLAAYFADRQAAGDLRDDIDPRLMAETLFAITSTMVMTRQLLGHAGSPEDLGADEAIRQLTDLFWSGVSRRDP